MSFDVTSIPRFEKQAKRLIKKYPSLKREIVELIESLKSEPEQGTPLGNHCFKIRIAIASKGKGKSGGGRIITHVYVSQTTVFLLTIFDKSEHENIADAELNELLRQIKK